MKTTKVRSHYRNGRPVRAHTRQIRQEKIKLAMKHPDVLGAGAKRREELKLTPDEKFYAVMKEYERGTLRSGNGEHVKSYQQAIAIAFSESGKDKKKRRR